MAPLRVHAIVQEHAGTVVAQRTCGGISLKIRSLPVRVRREGVMTESGTKTVAFVLYPGLTPLD
jgi:hypothetical protein